MSSANALRVRSRVRVRSVLIEASYSPALRQELLGHLGTTGTVSSYDPRWTLPWRIELDDETFLFLTEDNLEVLDV